MSPQESLRLRGQKKKRRERKDPVSRFLSHASSLTLHPLSAQADSCTSTDLEFIPGDLRKRSNLEATYIVRLFTTFESMLRDFLPRPHPNQPDRRSAYDLINRAASRLQIPAVTKDEAQQVREYRNRAVHQGGTAVTALLFSDALAALNRFLSWLPNPP